MGIDLKMTAPVRGYWHDVRGAIQLGQDGPVLVITSTNGPYYWTSPPTKLNPKDPGDANDVAALGITLGDRMASRHGGLAEYLKDDGR